MCNLLEQQEAIKKQTHMLEEAQKHKAMKILRTAPGIGVVRAAQLLSSTRYHPIS